MDKHGGITYRLSIFGAFLCIIVSEQCTLHCKLSQNSYIFIDFTDFLRGPEDKRKTTTNFEIVFFAICTATPSVKRSFETAQPTFLNIAVILFRVTRKYFGFSQFKRIYL